MKAWYVVLSASNCDAHTCYYPQPGNMFPRLPLTYLPFLKYELQKASIGLDSLPYQPILCFVVEFGFLLQPTGLNRKLIVIVHFYRRE